MDKTKTNETKLPANQFHSELTLETGLPLVREISMLMTSETAAVDMLKKENSASSPETSLSEKARQTAELTRRRMKAYAKTRAARLKLEPSLFDSF